MSIPYTDTTVPVCHNCGALDSGTRFCESCGASLAAQRQTDATATSISMTQPSSPAPAGAAVASVRIVPQLLYLIGVIGSAVFSIAGTFAANSSSSYNSGPTAILLVLDVLTIAADVVALVGLIRLGARSSAVTAVKVLGIILFLAVPAMDVVALASDVTGGYSAFAYFEIGGGFVSFALIAALSWLMVGRFAGRSYFLLFIVLGTFLLTNLLGGVGYGLGYAAYFALRTAIVAAGLVVVVVVAPRIRRTVRARLTPTTPPGAALISAPVAPNTTNGFAIAALVMGLLGGTLLPIIFGHVAHSQIRRTGQAGWGMATAGLVLGYICSAIVLVIVVVAIVAAVQAPHYYG